MRWTPSNWMIGIQSLLKGPANTGGTRQEVVLSDIREAMLHSLGEVGAERSAAIRRKVTYAHGFQDLWYLRGDVMSAIASIKGEAVARHRISEISDMFKGYLPQGLVSRPSPLRE